MRAVREQFGEPYAQAGLLVSPSIAYMYTLRPRSPPSSRSRRRASTCWRPRPCAAVRAAAPPASPSARPRRSSSCIARRQCYLWEKQLVAAPRRTQSYNVVDPELHAAGVLACPGAARRCRCTSSTTRACAAAVRLSASTTTTSMQHGACARPEVGGRVQAPAEGAPGRGDQADRRFDHAVDAAARAHDDAAHGGLRDRPRPARRACARRCTASRRTSPPARCRRPPSIKLLDGETNKVGFASACQAFGHRYLLGFLEQRGLARATVTPTL